MRKIITSLSAAAIALLPITATAAPEECPDLTGHWTGSCQSGHTIEAFIVASELPLNIKVATMFYAGGALANIASYDLYPDGKSKFKSSGESSKYTATTKNWCADGKLYLHEYRAFEDDELQITWAIELVGYFERVDANTVTLTSVDNSLPSGDCTVNGA